MNDTFCFAGQLRTVSKLEKRVAAAVHLGFDRVVAPVGTKDIVNKSLKPHVVQCRDVRDLIRFVRRSAPQASAADEDTDEDDGMFIGSDGNLEAPKNGATSGARTKQRGRMRRRWSSKKSSNSSNGDGGGAVEENSTV